MAPVIGFDEVTPITGADHRALDLIGCVVDVDRPRTRARR